MSTNGFLSDEENSRPQISIVFLTRCREKLRLQLDLVHTMTVSTAAVFVAVNITRHLQNLCRRNNMKIHCRTFNVVRLSNTVKAEFTALGSSYINRLAMRDMWAFVGQKGIKGRTTIEEVW